MIPLRLCLTNFLSYRQATLDFRGLHTACVCGANGAGKSSLLEAITWALWGQSRAALGDDVIHQGADEARVDFIFVSQGQLYRVLRRRPRQQSALLEFQIGQLPPELTAASVEPASLAPAIAPTILQTEPQTEPNWAELPLDDLPFRSLTTKGLRPTQQQIIHSLKLDYDTFVNSAYLRQGRADEFMLKRPNERKQVLASLLKLDQYDALAEQARERGREAKAQAQVLEIHQQQLSEQLTQVAWVETELAEVSATLAALQRDQAHDQGRRQALVALQQQRQDWQQQQRFAQQQRDRLQADLAQLHQRQQVQTQAQQQWASILAQADSIEQAYKQWQQWQRQDEQLTDQAEQHRGLIEQQQQCQRQLDQHQAEQDQALARCQAQQETLERQQAELQLILERAPAVAEAKEKLGMARSRLTQLDQLEAEVMPLVQQQQQLQRQLQQIHSQKRARLDQLQRQCTELQACQTQLGPLELELETTSRQLSYLEQRQRIQEQVRERGLERRGLLERLMIHREEYEAQLAAMDDNVRQLAEPDASCPLCDRPLDDKHLQAVQRQQEGDRQGILDLLIVVRDQTTATQREIEILRDEYHAIEREQAGYGGFLERRGQLQQQLAQVQEQQRQLTALAAELAPLQQQLDHDHYAPELQQQLQQLSAELTALAYDERNHALARGGSGTLALGGDQAKRNSPGRKTPSSGVGTTHRPQPPSC